MHLVGRVVCSRVLDHRDLVPELGGEANGCLHARVRNEPDDDESMDSMLLELRIEIGIGKAAGTLVRT